MTNQDCMKLNELRDLQLTRLRNTVKKAYDSIEFFKKSFDEVSFKPADIKSLEDIKYLPFSAKTDLQENYPYGLLDGSKGKSCTHPGFRWNCRRLYAGGY